MIRSLSYTIMKEVYQKKVFSSPKILPYTMLITSTNLVLIIIQAQYFICSFFQDTCSEIEI